MSIEILESGALTTVQDLGREGARLQGFGTNGVMDESSARLANALVGNGQDFAVLEMTMLGAKIRFDESCLFALCGADMKPELNGEPVKMNKLYKVNSGDILKLGFAVSGLRTYLAISGGIECPEFLGSRSTNIKCIVGGYYGRKLQRGDILQIGSKRGHIYNPNYAEVPYSPPSQSVTVRAVAGPQYDMFDEKGKNAFWNTPFKTTVQSDRMGIRLMGAELTAKGTTDIISDAIVKGSVQVSANLQPIILMADAQTTGGYAKIANVITADLPLLAQLKPDAEVRFKQVTVKQAEKAYKKFIKHYNKLSF
ncbi:MAG: biotin-dependent carboxyltransferase family protein [Eubacteriales bacterium]|nr:biotin-dependent carboxyltransferase family protein [Eubacteriales bacterium]